MRIVVTGASGNVGTAVLRRLRGHELIGIARRRPAGHGAHAGVRWIGADLAAATALPVLQEAFAGADAVVHCAWMIQPSHDRELMHRTNQGGTANVLAAAVLAGVPHVVHLSSVGAYTAAPSRRVDESWPVGGFPSSPYSVDKAAVERLLHPYEAALTITRLRPTLILQPAAASEIRRYFVGPVPLQLLRPGVTRLLPWPRQLRLQFVHADDVAAAIELVLERRAGGAFNVASEPTVDRTAFAAIAGGVGPDLPVPLLRAAAAATWRARVQPTEAGWLDLAVGAPLLDCSRLHALGWAPEHRGDETLARFVEALFAGVGGPGPVLRPATDHETTVNQRGTS